MVKPSTNRFYLTGFAAAILASSLLAEAPAGLSVPEGPSAESKMERLFTLKVLPLFKEKCFGCHGNDPDDMRAAYDMSTRDALIVGGESGEQAVEVGDAESSILVQSLRWDYYEMPPKENDRLNEEEISWVSAWIDAGAPWPDKDRRREILEAQREELVNEDGMLVATSGGLSDEWTYRRYEPDSIWAFQPVLEPMSPEGLEPAGVVDYFINRSLEDVNLKAAPRAELDELVRRVYLDLTGLPPTPHQRKQFVSAASKDFDTTWSQLVDELMASPQYGERWAQHWLDVVRYADTGGMSNDYERSNAWRYRDYVVRSFNDDKPLDQFIIEQLAGDEYDAEEVAAGRESDLERLIATGFLRMGPFDTAMVPQEESQQILRDDMVHSIGQSFLSTPMRCCKCHDHKFDPVPTRDYYRMYAALATTQPAEMDLPMLDQESQEGFDEGRETVQSLYDFATQRVNELTTKREDAAKAWYAERDLEYKDLNARNNDPDASKSIGLA
ncbi:MAG: DUF1549 domain-containing protein, partial [Planctomycetota bacterium]